MKITPVPIDSPECLSDLAWKDQLRIADNVKKLVPELVVFSDSIDPNEWIVVRRGKGPNICIQQGYDNFKASYMEAEDKLVKDLAEELSSLVAPGLFLEWHFQRDAMCAVWGDFGWHKFIILRRRTKEDPIV